MRTTTLLCLGALAALAGCGTRGELFEQPLRPLPPVATRSTLVQVVPQTRRAVVLTPGDITPAALTLSPGARVARAIPGTDTLVVLGGTARAPKVDVVDAALGTVLSLDAPGYFDAITFSPDGRFGVLSYLSSGGTGELLARNLNEVGLLAVGGRTLTRLQLDTESLAPRSILFGPAEANRQLVAVTLDRGVAVFDALHPEVAARRISIRPQGSTVESVVQQAVFSRDLHWLFLRATTVDDVIVVELGPEIGQPISASINFVAGGRGLSDIAQPPEGLEDSVLAAFPGSNELFLLDAQGIQDRSRRLLSVAAFNNVAVLSGNRVLAWDSRTKDIGAWDVTDGRSGTVVLDGVPGAPLLAPQLNKAVFALPSTQPGGGPALTAVTVVDETNRLRLKLQGIQLTRPFTTWAIDATAQRLFFSAQGSTSIVSMDLSYLRLLEVPLDASTTRLHYLAQSDSLAAVHGESGRLGDVTLLPAGTSERAGATRYSDFILTDDLDRTGDLP